MTGKIYGDTNGTYADFGTAYSDASSGLLSPMYVYDTAKTVGATMKQEYTQPLTVIEILKKILANEERILKSYENQMHWWGFRKNGISIILDKEVVALNSKNWDLACDEMERAGVMHVELVVSDPCSRKEIIDRPVLKNLIDSMEQDQPKPVSDREVFAILSALQLYQKRLRSQPCSEPAWQKMQGINGLITMNIDRSASNLVAWDTAFKLLYRDIRFCGGTNWDIWDLDLGLLDDIIGAFSRSRSFSRSMNETSVKVSDVATSDPIETVSNKAEPNYYPSKEGMVMGYPAIEECRAQSESITASIAQIREQLDDIFKQSIGSGSNPDVAATCLIEPMIAEYADFGIEIAKPLTHILFQLRAAGRNPIRYASWMACSGLVAQAKALVKPYTPRPDGCTLFEYQSALKKLAEVAR